MSNNLDLRPLREKLFLTYHEDGIIDMTIGLSAIGFGIFMATEMVALLILAWLPMLLYYPMKQSLSVPRLGFVRFTSKKTSVLRYSLTALIGLLVLVLFIILSIYGRGQTSAAYKDWMRQYHMAVYGAILGLLSIGVALFSGMRRFYLYGLLTFLAPTVSALIGVETFIPVLGVGSLLAASGLLMALRFVRAYPLQEAE